MSVADQSHQVETAVEVSILVNNKPVSVPKHTTGAEIKDRASVSATFQLFRIAGKTEHKVEDGENVTVHENEAFIASPSLDPS